MTKPIRHLHFTQSLDYSTGGGLAVATIELHHTLRKFTDSLLIGTSDTIRKEEDKSIHGLQTAFPKFFFRAPELKQHLSGWVQEYDIVHGHGFYTYLNWQFGKAAIQHNKPMVYHPQGMLEPWALRRSAWKKSIVKQWFENANREHVSLWRALTKEEADQIRKLGLKGEIIIAPNCINLEQYDQVERPTHPPQRTLLYLSRLHEKKGINNLLRVWPHRPLELKDWKLKIAGMGAPAFERRLKHDYRNELQDESIEWVGHIEGEERILAYKSADAFILPSYSEGFSMAILEAMACELPIFATHSCNFPEIGTGAGFLTNPGAGGVKALLDQLGKCSDLDLKALGQYGRTLVEKNYRWENIAKTIHDACVGVIQ